MIIIWKLSLKFVTFLVVKQKENPRLKFDYELAVHFVDGIKLVVVQVN